ncbi:MAG TPA: tetratricopeptide repeat protein [Acidimicrobiales bacterium]|nr:tetratricopeptide repeat protein [Acidimicrobiales bacterium]
MQGRESADPGPDHDRQCTRNVRVHLLGRLAVEVDGARTDLAGVGALGRVAFAYLVLERRRPVPRDELADVLWGEELPPTWTSALRGALSRVRRALGDAGVLRSEARCYQLRLPSDVEVDVEEVAAVVAAGTGPLARVADLASRRFLPGAGGAWVEGRQRELDTLRVRALELLAEACSATGDHRAAVAAAGEAVALAPLQESAHRRLMAAHEAGGDRAAALRAYEACRRVLAEELGVGPSPATDALYVRLLRDEPVTNLPVDRTSFVGREAELDELRRLVESSRLVTLTGPGGVGKSRLAVRVAGSLVDRYRDGVWLVELAGLSDPALVVPEVLSVLGLPEAARPSAGEALARHLADRAVLLVLDNCEHLVAACATFADLVLRRAPGVRILATSREHLGVPGEVVWPVPPLPVPPPDGGLDDLDALLRYPAVGLFVDRARSAAQGLDLTGSAAAVAKVCARLDGIPLAIELAAARAKVLSPAEIVARLNDHLRLLVGGPRAAPDRHRTLRAAIDWSYESLAPAERALFARLSVFAGGWGLDAAQQVCAEPGDDILDALQALVDKSLVTVDRDRPGGTRYRMLATLRQYGGERLAASGETGAVRARHLAWALRLAEAPENDRADEQARRLAALDDEHDNLRAALDWAGEDGRVDEGLRLAAALVRFWEIRGHLGEGRARLEAFAAQGGGAPELRAKALNAAAVLAQRQFDFPAARAAYQEALVVQRARGDRLGVATALHGLANLAVNDGDLAGATALFEENLAIARELGATRMQAASLMNLGVIAQSAFMHGRRPMEEAAPEADRHYRASLGLYEELGDRYGQALALENLGTLTRLHQGDHDGSRRLHERSLAIRRELGDRIGIADSARYLAALVMRTGDLATARRLHEERLAIERELGNVSHVAEALTDLGEIAMVEGRFLEAGSFLGEAQAIDQAAADGAALQRVLVARGDLARRMGAYGESRDLLDRSLRLAAELGNRAGAGWALVQLARLARTEGRAGAALAAAGDGLALAEEHELWWVESAVLDLVGGIAADGGDAATAARLAAAAAAMRGPSFRPLETEPGLDPDVLRAALGPAAFEAAHREGAALTVAARRDLARSVTVA